jgi:hypothetical protein
MQTATPATHAVKVERKEQDSYETPAPPEVTDVPRPTRCRSSAMFLSFTGAIAAKRISRKTASFAARSSGSPRQQAVLAVTSTSRMISTPLPDEVLDSFEA